MAGVPAVSGEELRRRAERMLKQAQLLGEEAQELLERIGGTPTATSGPPGSEPTEFELTADHLALLRRGSWVYTSAVAVHGEMLLALQVVLVAGSFEPGTYVRDSPYDSRGWRRKEDC